MSTSFTGVTGGAMDVHVDEFCGVTGGAMDVNVDEFCGVTGGTMDVNVDEFCGVTGSRDFSRLANLFNTLQYPLSNDSTFLCKKYISSCALSRSRIDIIK